MLDKLGTISPSDWVALAIGVIGLLTGYLQSKNRLPKWARKWLSKIGEESIQEAIDYAAKIQGLTPEERRREAVAYLIRVAEKEFGFPIPTSVANLLVEYVYQQWKRRQAER